MKSDIDRLMAARGFDAIVVIIDDAYSAPLDYLVGRVSLTGGMVFKDWQSAPVLVVNSMEREEAAVTGLKVFTYDDLGYYDLLNAHDNDRFAANVALWGKCLEEFGTPYGRVGIYGIGKVEQYIALARALEVAFPQYDFVGESGTTLFDEASFTKDADELARMQSVAEQTSAVVNATWDFIAGHRADTSEIVVRRDGMPLTIGDVKRFVRRALMERDLEETDMIFAQGRDGGFPHSRGNNAQPLRLGEAIVFDLFPREQGGGYYHDMTRTWCIGYAPDEIREAHYQVMEAFNVALNTFEVGRSVCEMQDAVQSYFDGRKHPTQRSHPGTTVGYTHSLGHGLGLSVHEGYTISHLNKTDTFQLGNIITIEPGLYYPEQGYGVRIEDTFYVGEGGMLVNPRDQLVSLTQVPKDLVLPLRG